MIRRASQDPANSAKKVNNQPTLQYVKKHTRLSGAPRLMSLPRSAMVCPPTQLVTSRNLCSRMHPTCVRCTISTTDASLILCRLSMAIPSSDPCPITPTLTKMPLIARKLVPIACEYLQLWMCRAENSSHSPCKVLFVILGLQQR